MKLVDAQNEFIAKEVNYMETTAMIKAACNADRQPSYARVVMTIEDCISEYEEYEEYQKRKAAGQGD